MGYLDGRPHSIAQAMDNSDDVPVPMANSSVGEHNAVDIDDMVASVKDELSAAASMRRPALLQPTLSKRIRLQVPPLTTNRTTNGGDGGNRNGSTPRTGHGLSADIVDPTQKWGTGTPRPTAGMRTVTSHNHQLHAKFNAELNKLAQLRGVSGFNSQSDIESSMALQMDATIAAQDAKAAGTRKKRELKFAKQTSMRLAAEATNVGVSFISLP